MLEDVRNLKNTSRNKGLVNVINIGLVNLKKNETKKMSEDEKEIE